MAGLLGTSWEDPQSAAIMQLAGGLMGGNFAQGASAYGATMAGAKDAALKRQLVQMQFEEAQAKHAQDQSMRALAARFVTPAVPGLGAIQGDAESGILPSAGRAAVPAGYDFAGYSDALAGINPQAALTIKQSLVKDSMFNKADVKDFTPESVAKAKASGNVADLVPLRKMEVSPGGQVFDPYSIKPGQTFADPNKPFAAGPMGPVANLPFQQYEIGKARSGAANVNNTVSVAGPENQYNKDIGAGLAKEGLALVDAAKLAPESVRNARAIKSALDSGAITGTAADTRLAVQKALETTGMIGPGKAASTQELMSGLSKLTLNGIKTSGLGGGQGFTDKDREFLNSAISGTLTDTPANLRRVADLAERQAIATHAKGATVIKRWQADPALRSVVQDTTLDAMPAGAEPSTAAKPITGKTFDTKPPAQQFKGKTATGPDGKRYKSDGMIWKEVQ